MALQLAPSVHAVVVDEDLVILDIPGDRYLAVPGGGVWVEGRGAAAAPSPEVLAELLGRAGIPRGRGADGLGRAPPPLPTGDIRDVAAPALRVRHLAALGAGLLELATHYSGRPLQHLLAFPRQAGARAVAEGGGRAELAALFARLAPWAPAPGKCLARSFLLLRFLQRFGCDADWVIGVRTWPFSAHCWLQADGVVLDDEAERLAAYQPIVAV